MPEDAGFVDGGGTFTEGWAANLGDDFKDDAETLARFKTVQDLSKSYMEAYRKIGMSPDKLVQIPDDDSPDEVKAKFYKARGKPDKPEEYEYDLPEAVREKVEKNDERLEKFRKFAHEKLHLSKSEFRDALDFYYTDIAESMDKYDMIFEEQRQKAHDEGMEVLKKLLGNAVDERAARANIILRRFGEQVVKDAEGNEINPLEKLFEEAPQLKNSPWMTLILDNIASKMGEDTIKGLTAATVASPAELDTKIAELRNSEAYTNRLHPDHKRVHAEMQELYKKRYPA